MTFVPIREQCAELGYNPIKPGRPSHNYHSFFIGRARIALGVDVRPGKQHFGRCGMKRLWALIDALPPNRWPALLRGDVGYGNDATMCEAEARGIPYLFKIKRSRNIQKLFRILSGGKDWKDCGSGWEALEQRVKLDGWQCRRRVLFIRRPAEKKLETVESKKTGRKPRAPKKSTALVPTAPAVVKQAEFDFVKDVKGREWDYCVLVTNDEKNVFCRLANPTAHREAITSRPAYMGIMGRIVESGRKRIIHLTSTHAESELIQRALGTVAAFFRWLKSTAEHLDEKTRWYVVLRCAFRKLLMPEQPLGAVIPIQ